MQKVPRCVELFMITRPPRKMNLRFKLEMRFGFSPNQTAAGGLENSAKKQAFFLPIMLNKYRELAEEDCSAMVIEYVLRARRSICLLVVLLCNTLSLPIFYYFIYQFVICSNNKTPCKIIVNQILNNIVFCFFTIFLVNFL